MKIGRRQFLHGVLAAGTSLWALNSAQARSSSSSLKIRHGALDLDPQDQIFKDYAGAVKAMHALPATDRRNWRRQAEIHADFCKHTSNEFLPWHRHYITQFEKICGEMIGKADFALPYWDWSKQSGKIPDAFFDMQELDVEFWKDNGIYSGESWGDIDSLPMRLVKKNVGVQSDPRGGTFTDKSIKDILKENKFVRFTNKVEVGPHNTGHVVVGIPNTGKAGHIGDGLSPLDPLFWLHHCNVDRLWALWQVAGNQTPQFGSNYQGNFVDAKGNLIDVTADTAKDFRAMGFTYDDFGDPIPFLAAAGLIAPVTPQSSFLDAFKAAPIQDRVSNLGSIASGATDVGTPSAFPVSVVNLQGELQNTRREKSFSFPKWTQTGGKWDKAMLSEVFRPRETPRKIQAIFHNVKTTSKVPPSVNVFLNCPYLTPTTPYTDGHYAGTFSFFGLSHKHDHENAGMEVVIDLERPIKELGLSKSDALKVQLMPIGGNGEVTFDKLEIQGI